MVTSEEIALVTEGINILNELGDNNEFKVLLEEIEKEDIIDLLRHMNPQEQQEFISSFS